MRPLHNRTVRRDQLARGLAPLFGDLPDDVMDEIVSRLEILHLEAGEQLVAQGDPGGNLYIVVLGRLRAFMTGDDGVEQEVAEIASGESVGETSLLTSEPHSVTYRAVRDTVLARLDRSDFVEFSHTHPGLLWTVTKLVTRRLKEARNGRSRSDRVRTVAIMFLDAAAAQGRFLERLADSLERHGSTVIVDSTSAANAGCGDADDLPTSAWFDRLEASHRFVLTKLDREVTSWSRMCVRQADRILLVASRGSDSTVRDAESTILASLPELVQTTSELVIVHDDGAARPEDTGRWLAGRDLLRHHHVRLDRTDDCERLARWLAGKAVGMVLAGGGAKAFVHLGVFQALQEAGVPVDMVGGSSLGSILAAGVAQGWEAETLIDKCRQAFTHRDPITDYSFPPLISMMRGKRMEKLLRRYFGEGDIEDLWLPYFCVSGNFSAGEMAVHRTGLLWRAIKASVALPGVLPPVVIDGQLHVDGGTFDNLPVEPMRAFGAGKIIACDIKIPLRPRLGYSETPSDWRLLVDRYLLRRNRLKVPQVMTTMFRSSFLASNDRRREAVRNADLYFCSPAGRVGLTHWKLLDKAMASGYAYAKRHLEEVGPEALVALGAPDGAEAPSMRSRRAVAQG